jgi:hypothetical protein
MPSGSAFSNIIGPVVSNIPSAVEPAESPYWRFVVTDNDSRLLTFLDRIAIDRTVTYALDQPAVATGSVPSDEPEINILHTDGDPFLAEGTRLLYGFRREVQSPGIYAWIIRFAGRIEQLQDVAESDNAMSHYSAFDPWRYLNSRVIRNSEGGLVGQNGISWDDTRIDVIVGSLLEWSKDADGNTFIDAGPDYGGTGWWDGTIQALDQIDINFQQGMTIGEAWTQLTSNSLCDIVLTPVWDPLNRPGILCDLNVYAQAGQIVDEAIFAWDKPSRSLIGLDRLVDGTARANNIKFWAGQAGSGTGGQSIPVQSDAVSKAKYETYWGTQFWPAQNVARAVEALAAAQLELRKDGKRTVSFTPAPERSPLLFQEYFLGDRVKVYASDRFREELAGYQRVYGIPLTIADDATETITGMLTSVNGT